MTTAREETAAAPVRPVPPENIRSWRRLADGRGDLGARPGLRPPPSCSPSRRSSCWPRCIAVSTAGGASCWRRAPSGRPSTTPAPCPSISTGRSATGPAATGRSRRCRPTCCERRVEITGPINDTKMVINMLSRNADGERADAAMLDFEDSMMPSWANVIRGLVNLRGAADGSLRFVKPAAGGRPEKVYELDPDDMPLLMVRCRGLHLEESNLRVDGEPLAAGILDLAMSAWLTAAELAGPRQDAQVLRAQVRAPSRGALVERALPRHRGGARAALGERCAPPSSSRRCRPPSRWRRSSTSCASAPPASTSAAGTRSSATSRC